MELTRFRRSLRRMSNKSSSFRDVLVLQDIADLILEESQFYEDNMKQHPDYGDLGDVTMGFFVDELINKVVIKLCSVERLGVRGVARKIIGMSPSSVEEAMSDWFDDAYQRHEEQLFDSVYGRDPDEDETVS